MKRFTGRISCPNCGRVYNRLFEELKPKHDDICDECGSTLIVRDDDNEETFMKRYEIYSNETEPLISYYTEKGLLYRLNGNLNEMKIHEQIVSILEGEGNG